MLAAPFPFFFIAENVWNGSPQSHLLYQGRDSCEQCHHMLILEFH